MTPREQAQQTSQAFPSRLKAFRKSVGLTQDELAEKAECSVVALSKFETGVSRPSFENLIALSAALDVPLDNLLGQSNSPQNVSARKTEAIAKLERAVSTLSVDWIDAITEIAKKAK